MEDVWVPRREVTPTKVVTIEGRKGYGNCTNCIYVPRCRFRKRNNNRHVTYCDAQKDKYIDIPGSIY